MAARSGFLNQSWNTITMNNNNTTSSSSSSINSNSSPRSKRSRLAILLIVLLCSAGFINFAHFIIVRVRDLVDDTVEPHRLFEQVAQSIITAGRQIVQLQHINQHIQNITDKKTNSKGKLGKQDTVALQHALRIGQYPDGTRELHTVADMRSHEIFTRIKRVFPNIAFVDEEEETNQLERIQPNRRRRIRPDSETAPPSSLRRNVLSISELAIYIDPLDATQEYSEGLTEYVSLSACIVHCGKPIAGLIYMPFSERLYWTRPGTGVHVNFDVDTAIMSEKSIITEWYDPDNSQAVCCDQRIKPRITKNKDKNEPVYESAISEVWKKGLRVIGSRSHKGNVSLSQQIIEELSNDITKNTDIKPHFIQAGGAGYKLIELLEGRSDAYLHPNRIRKWDLCAGDALLRASGGAITDWSGKPIDYCIYSTETAKKAATENNAEDTISKESKAEKEEEEETNSNTKDSKIDPKQFLVQGVIASGNSLVQHDLVAGVKKFGKGQNI